MSKCLNCGNEFESKRETAKFCSGKCRTEYSRKGSVQKETIESAGIVVVAPKPTLSDFEFKCPNTRMASGFWEDEKGKVVIRKAKYWYDVPLGAVPVAKKDANGEDEPKMPEFMNGRHYFLWRENGFAVTEEGSPIIVNPLPVYENVSVKFGGELSGMWSGR